VRQFTATDLTYYSASEPVGDEDIRGSAMKREIQQWEGEGGAISGLNSPGTSLLHGTPSQIEWAQRIRRTVNAEFDRVAEALVSATSKQSPENQRDAEAVIAILEEKRAEVMVNNDAGYFIHEWQETGGRVRQMIMKDGRYPTIRVKRAERRVALAVSDSADSVGEIEKGRM
jgi:hypothetical protein